MNKITLNENGGRYIRVNKLVARKAFETCQPVILCPVKLHPFGASRPSMMIDNANGHSFTRMVNDFEFYNCNLNETGYYAAYYVQVK